MLLFDRIVSMTQSVLEVIELFKLVVPGYLSSVSDVRNGLPGFLSPVV